MLLSPKRRLVTIGMLMLALTDAPSVCAHAFGRRYDLPIPLWLYLSGAAVAVALSFVIIAALGRKMPGQHTYPRVNLLRWRFGRWLAHPYLLSVLRGLAVLVFAVIVLAGLLGNQSPLKNIAPTLVWVVWWIGMAYICALIGDLWALINPWKTLFMWAETLYRYRHAAGELSYHHPYPRWLGYWPAVGLFLLFAWAELVWDGSEVPRQLAFMVLGYSLVTWGGMLYFGREPWLRGGEVFTVMFGVLARFAPLEIRVTDSTICASCSAATCHERHSACINCSACFARAKATDREWNLRPYAVGLLTPAPVHDSMLVFVLLILATVSFDGFSETPLWTAMVEGIFATPFLHPVLVLAYLVSGNVPAVIQSLGLMTAPVLFLGVFFVCSALMARATKTLHTAWRIRELARCFVLSLIPIAVAYHLAHYLSFLLVAGQLIIPLASDPFGVGWNLWGTTHYRLNIAVVNARFVWYTAVIAVVAGHIVAVYLAHIMALRVFKEQRLALRSQYPMLGLMVGYTMAGLWILAQPIVQ